MVRAIEKFGRGLTTKKALEKKRKSGFQTARLPKKQVSHAPVPMSEARAALADQSLATENADLVLNRELRAHDDSHSSSLTNLMSWQKHRPTGPPHILENQDVSLR